MEITQLSSRRPYLLRAFYEWLLDNQLTPHLVVNINVNGVIVPIEFACNGKIVLNIAPQAIAHLVLGNDIIQFNARFSGVTHQVVVPIAAVLAIYAREDVTGTIFKPEMIYEQLLLPDDYESVKDLNTETVISIIENDLPNKTQADDSEKEPPNPPRNGRRVSLRLVK